MAAIDFSDVGLDNARQLAENAGVTVKLVCADPTQPIGGQFELVVVAADAVALGGTLLVVGHDTTNLADGERIAIGALVRAERTP